MNRTRRDIEELRDRTTQTVEFGPAPRTVLGYIYPRTDDPPTARGIWRFRIAYVVDATDGGIEVGGGNSEVLSAYNLGTKRPTVSGSPILFHNINGVWFFAYHGEPEP